MKLLETTRKVIKFLFATLILIYQSQVGLHSLSKENSVSCAKGTMLLVVPRDKMNEEGSLMLQNDVWQ
jgi:hypothetical protein